MSLRPLKHHVPSPRLCPLPLPLQGVQSVPLLARHASVLWNDSICENKVPFNLELNATYNFPIFDKCQTLSAEVCALPRERAHLIIGPQLGKPDLRLTHNTLVVGYRLNRPDEPVFIAVSNPLLTEFGIHLRLESCGA